MSLKGYCNGELSKTKCARVKITEKTIQDVEIPVKENGFVLLGYKTGDLIFSENTKVVLDFDGDVDLDSEFIRNTSKSTLVVSTGSNGVHIYLEVLGQHDLPKLMVRDISENGMADLGSTNCKVDVLTCEKVFAPGSYFTEFPKNKVPHVKPYEIMGVSTIKQITIQEYDNIIRGLLVCEDVPDVIEQKKPEPSVPSNTEFPNISKMRLAYQDMIKGIYVIEHQGGTQEFQLWKQLYCEFQFATDTSPMVLVEYFKTHPEIQPSFQYDTTITQIKAHGDKWRPVTNKTYLKYFPEQKYLVSMQSNEDKAKKEAKEKKRLADLMAKNEYSLQFEEDVEFKIEISPSENLILNSMGLFNETIQYHKDEMYVNRSIVYKWDSLHINSYITHYVTQDVEYLFSFTLQNISYYFKNHSEIVQILSRYYVGGNRQSIQGILSNYLHELVKDKKIEDLTKKYVDYIGFHQCGWKIPQNNDCIMIKESVGKEIKESIETIDLDADLEGALKRIQELYVACGWDTKIKDVVFAWWFGSPFFTAMRDYECKLIPVLSLFADGDLGKSTFSNVMIKALGHLTGVLAANEASSPSRMQGMLSSSTFPIALDDIQTFSKDHLDDIKTLTNVGGKMRRKGAGKGGQYEILNKSLLAPICINQNRYSNLFDDPQMRQRIIDLRIEALDKTPEWNKASREVRKGDLLKIIYNHTKSWKIEDVMKIYDKASIVNGLDRQDKIFNMLSVGKYLFEAITKIELDFLASDIHALTQATRSINTFDSKDLILEYCKYATPQHLKIWYACPLGYDKFYGSGYAKPQWVQSPIAVKKDKDGSFWYVLQKQNVREILLKDGRTDNQSVETFYFNMKAGFDGDMKFDNKTIKAFTIDCYDKTNAVRGVMVKVPDSHMRLELPEDSATVELEQIGWGEYKK